MTEDRIDAALIVAYRRWNNVAKLIDILNTEGVRRIYIAIDSGPSSDLDSIFDVNKTVEVALKARDMMENVQVSIHSENVGCSAAVLSACDWFFENEAFGVVFEDDCIPACDFFTYAKHARQVISRDSDVWLFCGTQFAPELQVQDTWSLSKYALIWGWGTSREKWNQISMALKLENSKLKRSNLSTGESQYWRAGALRSRSGVVDAWDNILIYCMLTLGKKSVLPQCSLVSNVGNDSVATHTGDDSAWLRLETGIFRIPASDPLEDQVLDSWLNKNFYRISIRHILTTRITSLLDSIMRRKKRVDKLTTRWENARNNLTLLH